MPVHTLNFTEFHVVMLYQCPIVITFHLEVDHSPCSAFYTFYTVLVAVMEDLRSEVQTHTELHWLLCIDAISMSSSQYIPSMADTVSV